MQEGLIQVSFPEASAAEGNRLAGSLTDLLVDVSPTLSISRERSQDDSQDIGTILGIILGSASAISVAKGMAAFIARSAGAHMLIRKNGQVIFEGRNMESKDIPLVAAAMSESKTS